MTAPELSVVLPCRNQADHIGAVLERYFPVLDAAGVGYELVVVPNACTDRTPEIVAALAARDSRLRVAENPAGGWGLSVLTGLNAARGGLLCYANSARTDPADVPRLLELYRRHAPCLAKVRRTERGVPLRELGSWLYNLEARLLFGIATRDVNGTPKLFARQLFEAARPREPGDLIDLELMAVVRRLGVPVVELTVSGFQRHGGKSTTNLRSAARMYAGALRLWTKGGGR